MSQSQDDDFENRSEEGPPEPYNSWEEYFEDFDCQLEEAPRITVRQRIGNPKIRSVDEVPTSDLEEELNRLIELLYANNIVIDFIHDIDERQAYIFIVEELLEETMDDIRIPDMYSHFIYEDFHPNDEDDIELWTGEFLDAFFKDGPEGDFISIGDQELYDAAGNSIRQEEFKQQIDDFHTLYSIITEFKYEIINLNIQGDYSTVEVEIWWAGLNTHEQAIIRNHGISTLQLKRNRDVGWDVIQAKIVGWNN